MIHIIMRCEGFLILGISWGRDRGRRIRCLSRNRRRILFISKGNLRLWLGRLRWRCHVEILCWILGGMGYFHMWLLRGRMSMWDYRRILKVLKGFEKELFSQIKKVQLILTRYSKLSSLKITKKKYHFSIEMLSLLESVADAT